MKFFHSLTGFLVGLLSPVVAFFVASAIYSPVSVLNVGIGTAVLALSFGAVFHRTRRRLFYGFLIGLAAGCFIVLTFMKMMVALDTGVLKYI